MDLRPAHCPEREDSGREIAAAYPLSQLQHGMLYHALAAPGSGVDVEQMVCTLREEIDPAASINDQWRICFVWSENNAHQVQIVDYH